MSVERSFDFVVDVKGIQEALHDGEVRGVDTGGWIVVFAELGKESREYWIVVFGSRMRLSGIALTQVGDPLAHRVERRCD